MRDNCRVKRVVWSERCLACGRLLAWRGNGVATSANCPCKHSYVAPPSRAHMLMAWAEDDVLEEEEP